MLKYFTVYIFQENLHTELMIEDEYFDLQTEESVPSCSEKIPVTEMIQDLLMLPENVKEV